MEGVERVFAGDLEFKGDSGAHVLDEDRHGLVGRVPQQRDLDAVVPPVVELAGQRLCRGGGGVGGGLRLGGDGGWHDGSDLVSER